MKMPCLIPGLVGFVIYALHPLTMAALTAGEPYGGFARASVLDRVLHVEQGDTLALVAGIVLSAICWFYAERRERGPAAAAQAGPRDARPTPVGGREPRTGKR